MLASLVYLTWWAIDGADLRAAWDRPGEGGLPLWVAIDLVVALTVSWIPLVADYTRFSRDRRSALAGVTVGYFVASAWMFLLGVVLVLGRGLDDAASLPAAVATAGLASALALLAVTVDETDEAFANVYSAGVSLQNAATRVPQRLLVTAVAAVATLGALVIDLASYESFLLLLGSFFVPLFGVLLGDWLARGGPLRGAGHLRRARPSARCSSRPGSSASPSTSGCTRSAPPGGPICSPTRTRPTSPWAPRSRASPSRSRWPQAPAQPGDGGAPPRAPHRLSAVRDVAVVGSLASDVVADGAPRVGGAPFYAAAALRLLGRPSLVVTRCAERDRSALLPPLVAQGAPVEWHPSERTFRYRFSYDGGTRTMAVEETAEPWLPGPWLDDLRRCEAVHVGALAQGEFPDETLAALARGRRLSLDGQGLVRAAGAGPLRLEPLEDRSLLRHVSILKLAEEEAVVLAGGTDPDALAALGVPEVVLTRGEAGAVIVTRRRRRRGSRAGGAVRRPDRRRRRLLRCVPRLAHGRARPRCPPLDGRPRSSPRC